jgi:hypothetical protein
MSFTGMMVLAMASSTTIARLTGKSKRLTGGRKSLSSWKNTWLS